MEKTRTRNSKPTPRQIKAAKKIVENLGSGNTKSTQQILAEVGYSEAMTTNPQQVTESKGFKQALDAMGLTDELIVTALVEDIQNKPKRRTAELALAAKIKGLDRGGDVTPPPSTVNNTQINITTKEETAADYAEYLKQKTIVDETGK